MRKGRFKKNGQAPIRPRIIQRTANKYERQLRYLKQSLA